MEFDLKYILVFDEVEFDVKFILDFDEVEFDVKFIPIFDEVKFDLEFILVFDKVEFDVKSLSPSNYCFIFPNFERVATQLAPIELNWVTKTRIKK